MQFWSLGHTSVFSYFLKNTLPPETTVPVPIVHARYGIWIEKGT